MVSQTWEWLVTLEHIFPVDQFTFVKKNIDMYKAEMLKTSKFPLINVLKSFTSGAWKDCLICLGLTPTVTRTLFRHTINTFQKKSQDTTHKQEESNAHLSVQRDLDTLAGWWREMDWSNRWWPIGWRESPRSMMNSDFREAKKISQHTAGTSHDLTFRCWSRWRHTHLKFYLHQIALTFRPNFALFCVYTLLFSKV